MGRGMPLHFLGNMRKFPPALLRLDCMSMFLGSFQLREAVRDVINREFNGEMWDPKCVTVCSSSLLQTCSYKRKWFTFSLGCSPVRFLSSHMARPPSPSHLKSNRPVWLSKVLNGSIYFFLEREILQERNVLRQFKFIVLEHRGEKIRDGHRSSAPLITGLKWSVPLAEFYLLHLKCFFFLLTYDIFNL